MQPLSFLSLSLDDWMLRISVARFIFYLKFSTGRAFQANPFLHFAKSFETKSILHPYGDEYENVHMVFDKLLEPNFRQWNVMIRSCCMNADHDKALLLFCQMHKAGIRPDHESLPALIKSCTALSEIGLGRMLQGCVIKEGYESNAGVYKALMNMYAKCGVLHDSYRLFCGIGQRQDPVLWNILISGYAGAKCNVEAMELFYMMHICEGEPKPNAITIAIILPVCARLRALKYGKSIHAYAIKSGFELQTLVGNALLSMYAKCGSVLEDFHHMFHSIVCRDVISWNAMIAGYTENAFFVEAFEVFSQMLLAGVKPNYATIANVLPTCAILDDRSHGKEIHCYVLRTALDNDVSVCNAVMTFYIRIGDVEKTEYIFRKMYLRDLVSWNTIIAGYAANGWLSQAMELFHELHSTGMKPDSITLISILPVCAQLLDVQEGRKIHEYIRQHPEICDNTAVGNALISFHAKCGDLEDASQIFASMQKRDLISWNTMLAAYAESGTVEKVLDLLHCMHKVGIKPDSVTILSVLQECVVSDVRAVKEVHGYSIRASLTSKVTVGNAILDMYAKCRSIDYAFKTFKSLSGRTVVTGNAMISGCIKHGFKKDAEMIFDQMQVRDLTTWNLMVLGCAQNDCFDQALSLFHELQSQGMRPNAMSIMNMVSVCTQLVSVDLLRQCHTYAIRACFDDICLDGALLDAYSKCGNVMNAYKLFQMSHQKDLVTFTTMVSGYAMHGMGEEAVMVLYHMLESGIKPDHVIMTAVLSACSHAGLVEEGWKHFNSMDGLYSIKPTMEHYSCMVDLLARAGRLEEAFAFVNNMPFEANANVWGTLLGACKTYQAVELGQAAARRLFDVEAGNIGNYVVLSNIYAAEGRWDGVEEVRRLMKMEEIKKPAGCSWIEVERRMHVFVAADSSHPQRDNIYSMLKTLNQQIKEPLV